MKHNRFLSLALLGSFALLTVACVEEITSNEDLYRPKGTPIVFAAAPGYSNGVETKAEYSGVLYGGALSSTTPTYERIDWVNNDPIKIVYNQTPASYYVKGSTIHNNNTQNSYAELNLASGSSALEWDGSGNHVFYALYPAGASGAGTLSNTGFVTGSIPSAQNVTSKVISATENGVTFNKYQPDTEHYGYLVACENITSSSTQYSVDLHFKPAVTTFEFKLKHNSGEPDPRIMSIDLETETVNGSRSPLTGTFKFQILGRDESDQNNLGANWNKSTTSGSNRTTIESAGYKITVSFGSNGFQFANNNGYLDFSILTLPIELTGLKLTIHFANGDKVYRFKDNRSTGSEAWHTFAAAKKYIVTNYAPSGEWVYVLEPINDITVYGHQPVAGLPFTIKSYKYATLDPSTKIPVPWEVQYSATGSNWQPTNRSADFSLANVSGNGVNNSTYSTGEPNSAIIANSTTPTTSGTNTAAAIIARMQALSPRSDWDLSMHNIYGEDNVKGRTTANCYVVDRAGTYKFPAYFGNAYTNGTINWNAFRPGDNAQNTLATQISDKYVLDPSRPLAGSAPTPYMGDTYDDVRYLRDFRDATNNGITHYSIKGQYQNLASAFGTDYTPSDFEAVIVWQNSMTGTPIVQDNSTAVRYDWNTNMIYFTIDRNDIQPGNIVIALRGKVGTKLPAGTILWSWHIWVSDKDLHPADVTNADNVTVGLMPRNLGSIDRTGIMWGIYPDRYYYFNIVQTETGGLQEDFKVEQIGDGFSIDGNLGTNTYYQWGRKDPLIPADPTSGYSGQNPNGVSLTIYKDLSITNGTGPGVIPGSHYSSIFGSNGNGQTGNSDSATTLTGAMGPPDFLTGITPTNSVYNQTDYSDYSTGIKYPYKHLLNQESTGWIGGNINLWQYSPGAWTFGFPIHRANSAIPYNLWNASIYRTQDKGGEDKYKTIYDPCPPGFCVPNLSVFSGLEYIETVANEGNYYSDGRGGRVFFPFTGLRVFYNMTTYCELETEEVESIGYLWTDCPTAIKRNNQEAWYYAKALSFGGTATYPPSTTFDRGHNDYTRGSAMAIRPMVDPKFDK